MHIPSQIIKFHNFAADIKKTLTLSKIGKGIPVQKDTVSKIAMYLSIHLVTHKWSLYPGQYQSCIW